MLQIRKFKKTINLIKRIKSKIEKIISNNYINNLSLAILSFERPSIM